HGDCPTLACLPGQAFATRDSFVRTEDGAYRYVARLDDIIVHPSGEKSNAQAIERALSARLRGMVEHVAVVGAGRLRLTCVVQWNRRPTDEDRATLFRAMKAVNAELPGHSRLQEDLVLSLTPEGAARLPLSAKGTVMRSRVEQALAAELEALWGAARQGPSEPGGTPRLRLRGLPDEALRSELRA